MYTYFRPGIVLKYTRMHTHTRIHSSHNDSDRISLVYNEKIESHRS